MKKSRIILLATAVVLVALIYMLPMVVVDNDQEEVATAPAEETMSEAQREAIASAHSVEVDEAVASRITRYRDSLVVAANSEKSVIFADSLAGLYQSINRPDSAAMFIEEIADTEPILENFVRAGDAYYEAYGFAADPGERAAFATKARAYYERVLEQDPSDLRVKNRVAMTWLASSSPMQGIMMLREIVQEDPTNEQALFNLGVLSMQSGQYDRAVERFESLIELYPENIEAQFFLGVSYMETGKRNKARKQFELVKERGTDPETQAAAESYLESI
ncbi:MAG: tetratricopeptide repeat protein [Cyclobacteriaceae bacterium]